MTEFSPGARLWLLALCFSGTLAGCKKADAPLFSPAPGTYTATQYVAITSTSIGAAIVYTTDGSTPSCLRKHGTLYSAPVAVTTDTTLRAMACALLRDESTVTSGSYFIRPPAAAPVFDPAPGAYTGVQHVTLSSATAGATFRYSTDGQNPVCGGNTPYDGPIEISNSLTLKAVACADGFSDSPVTSGGYDITLPPEESVWKSIDFNNLTLNPPILAAGSHGTNEAGNALNISGRGKVESTRRCSTTSTPSVTGDFVMTARLDGVDFAGFTSNQGRAALLLTPDITATGNTFVYGSSAFTAAGTTLRAQRSARGRHRQCNGTLAVTGTGARYLRLTRIGNTYEPAVLARRWCHLCGPE